MENITMASMFENYSSVDFGNTTQHGNETGDLNLLNLPLFLRVPQWNRLVANVFICLMCVVGISGNIILIGALQRKKKKGSTDVYIIFLAAGDITTLLLNGTVDFLRCIPDLWRTIGSDWLCRLHFYVQHGVFLVTTILIFVIGLDRYFHVFRPHSTAKLEKVSRPVSLAAYAVSAGISVVFIFTTHHNDLGICELNPGFKHINGIMYAVVNLIALVSSITLGLIYFKVTRFLKKREEARRLRIPEVVRRQQGADAIRFPSTARVEQTEDVAIIPSIKVASVSLEMDMASACDKPYLRSLPTKPIGVALTPNINPGSNSSHAERRVVNENMRRVARTTVMMSLVTLVYFVSTVLPLLALCVLTIAGETSEEVDMALFLGTRMPMLGNVANPILFIISSSEFRQLTIQMFQSLCKRNRSQY